MITKCPECHEDMIVMGESDDGQHTVYTCSTCPVVMCLCDQKIHGV